MVTPLQQKIYLFIQDFMEQHAYSPSLQEIARGIGISPKSLSLISRSIHSLVAAGKLVFSKKGYRNLQVVESGHSSLPLLGRIAAGKPIAALEDKRSIDLSALFMGANHFLLEVQGDSMIDEGILDGDFVICKPVQQAEEGEIVVALIDAQDATLKRLSYKTPERITLIPANTALKPKAYLPQRVQIQGIFIGLLRIPKPGIP